ncbi:MAG: AAA family ATPase, partial [Bacteroidota bacterium]
LSESEAVVSEWKKNLLNALGNNVAIINELVPEFELSLGSFPPPPLLSPEETMNRFLYTWQVFFKTMATADHPLIIFLDDLQWTDLASLQLIESLFSDPDIRWFCFIGSYRHSEVNEVHALRETAKKIREKRPFHEIHLSPLNKAAISELLADIFYQAPEETLELAGLLLHKTQGNPFFLVEALKTLYDQKGLFFDDAQEKWNWNIQHIHEMDITDNVVELMVNKIRKCSPLAQKNMMLAACIGHQFSLRSLSWITSEEALPFLSEALDQGLIFPTDNNYLLLNDTQQRTLLYQDQINEGTVQLDAGFRFLHDRVQQAAYSQLSVDERALTHLKLGQKLLAHTPEDQKNDHIFEICTHINLGRSKINDPKIKDHYASLNLIAGQKAIASNAYGPALDFLENGLDFLPSDHWSKAYKLSHKLWVEVAQCHILLGQIDQAESVLYSILSNCKNRLHKLIVYRMMVEMYTMQVAHTKVLETVKQSLKLFKIRIPLNPFFAQLRILKDILIVMFRLRNKKAEAILDFPLSDSPEHIELSNIVLKAGPSAYVSNQNLFAWMVLFEVRYAIRLGTTPFSPLGYLGYGMILHKVFGNLEAGFAYADASMKLNEQMGNPLPVHVLKFTFHNFLKHFKDDVAGTADLFKQYYRLALESGDHIYTGFFLSNLTWNSIAKGENLDEICTKGQQYLKLLEQQKDFNSYDMLLSRLSAPLTLRGKEITPWKLGGVEVSVAEKRAQFRTEQAYSQLALSYVSSFQLSYLLNDQPIQLEQILEADKNTPYLEDTYVYADLALMVLLAIEQFCRAQRSHKTQLLKIAKKHNQYLKKRAKMCPDNYLCHSLLMEGLLALIENKPQNAN